MSSLRMARRRGLTIAALTALISGVAVFLNSYGVRAWSDPTAYTAVKNVAAALLLGGTALPLLLRKGRGIGARRWLRLALIGVIGGGIPFILFFQGLAVTDPARAALIHKSMLVWVALLAIPLLGERLSALHLGAIGLLLAGQAMLGPAATAGWGGGETLILAATLLWAVEVILIKRILPDVDPALAGAARLGIGAVVVLVWTIATGGLGAIGAAGPAAWLWAAACAGSLALFVAGWYTALSLAPAVDVTAMLVPGALVTAMLAAGVRGAAWPSPVSAVLLILGAAMVVAAGRRSAPR